MHEHCGLHEQAMLDTSMIESGSKGAYQLDSWQVMMSLDTSRSNVHFNGKSFKARTIACSSLNAPSHSAVLKHYNASAALEHLKLF